MPLYTSKPASKLEFQGAVTVWEWVQTLREKGRSGYPPRIEILRIEWAKVRKVEFMLLLWTCSYTREKCVNGSAQPTELHVPPGILPVMELETPSVNLGNVKSLHRPTEVYDRLARSALIGPTRSR